MQVFKQHPLGKLFPPIGLEQTNNLAEDIKANGLANPITIFEGKILDGWNRYRVCKAWDIPLKTVEYKGDAPALFVISQNIHRRHLSTTQRVTLAKKLLEAEEIRAAKRRASKPGRKVSLPPMGGNEKRSANTAAAKVAKAVGVSARSVERAKAIDKKAVPEVVGAVESGAMSLREGEQVSKLPKAEQRKIAKAPKAVRRGVAKASNDLEALKALWERVDQTTQREFLKWAGYSTDAHAVEAAQ